MNMLLAPLAACLVMSADQLAKAIVLRRFVGGRCKPLVLNIGIQPVTNLNAGFTSNPYLLLALWVLVVPCIFLLLQHGIFLHQPLAQLGLGAAIGGAASNLLDRFRRKGVVDFISVGSWHAFNIADIAIVGGIIVAILSTVR